MSVETYMSVRPYYRRKLPGGVVRVWFRYADSGKYVGCITMDHEIAATFSGKKTYTLQHEYA